MEEALDHNQSGLPVKDEEEGEESQQKIIFDSSNQNQASGPIEVPEDPSQPQISDLISNVPRMVKLLSHFPPL